MSTLGKIVGSLSVIGGVLGAAALGGATAHRLTVHRYRQLGGDSDMSFDALAADRSYTVDAPDGVALHVEEVGELDAPLTVVFSHGWTLRSGSWHFQRIGLAGPDFGPDPDVAMLGADLLTTASTGPSGDEPGSGGLTVTDSVPRRRPAAARSGKSTVAPRARSGSHPGTALHARLVFYDQRSHGRSSRAAPGRSRISDLAADLAAVIDIAAPTGPLVLVGHSMGGMALMELAGADPDLFARRVVGVGLLSTSASDAHPGPRRWLQVNGTNPVLPAVAAAAARYPRAFERGRDAGHDAIWLLTRALGFADPQVSAALVDYLDLMISATPVDVIADFAPALFTHDQSAALPALAGIPALIAVGEADRMTPPSRSIDIADALPGAELMIIPGAGHMAIMEAAEVINLGLRRMLRAAWRYHQRANDSRRAGNGGDR